jgi:hypothetical protein
MSTNKDYKKRVKIETSTHIGSTPLPHKSSSTTHRIQELSLSKGENNERCDGGGDGDDPPSFNIEKTHIVG